MTPKCVRCVNSPAPWCRRCEHRPAGSGEPGWGRSGPLTARSCAGRQSRPCAGATLSRSAAGDQTSDWGVKKKNTLLLTAITITEKVSADSIPLWNLIFDLTDIHFEQKRVGKLNFHLGLITRGGCPCEWHGDWNSEKRRTDLNTKSCSLTLCTAMQHSAVNWTGSLNSWKHGKSISHFKLRWNGWQTAGAVNYDAISLLITKPWANSNKLFRCCKTLFNGCPFCQGTVLGYSFCYIYI